MTDLIVSIPHTGSRFLRERLGIEEIVHTERNWHDLINKTAGHHLIAPLRNPMSVLSSAVRRTPPELIMFDEAGWIHNWYMMHALTLIRQVDFIVLEHESDPRITDWSPVGHNDDGERPIYNRPLPPMDLGKIYELPFVVAAYR